MKSMNHLQQAFTHPFTRHTLLHLLSHTFYKTLNFMANVTNASPENKKGQGMENLKTVIFDVSVFKKQPQAVFICCKFALTCKASNSGLKQAIQA